MYSLWWYRCDSGRNRSCRLHSFHREAEHVAGFPADRDAAFGPAAGKDHGNEGAAATSLGHPSSCSVSTQVTTDMNHFTRESNFSAITYTAMLLFFVPAGSFESYVAAVSQAEDQAEALLGLCLPSFLLLALPTLPIVPLLALSGDQPPSMRGHLGLHGQTI